MQREDWPPTPEMVGTGEVWAPRPQSHGCFERPEGVGRAAGALAQMQGPLELKAVAQRKRSLPLPLQQPVASVPSPLPAWEQGAPFICRTRIPRTQLHSWLCPACSVTSAQGGLSPLLVSLGLYTIRGLPGMPGREPTFCT